MSPVRLDNYIFKTGPDDLPVWDHPRRGDVTKKMIADATGWKRGTKKYKAVLDRLIRDMKEQPQPSAPKR